ncbi:MAG: hypothetical protein QF893_13965 [Alphaproteobacteria bacterium]|nr:hypothetical protein [Alphaproteobacteria bacterium]
MADEDGLEARALAASRVVAGQRDRERDLESELTQLEAEIRELRQRNEELQAEVDDARIVKDHLYFATTNTRKPKDRATVRVETTTGKTYEGCVFITGDQRIKDLLNGEDAFLPLETANGEIHLINRECIAEVIPYEDRASPIVETS